MIDLGVVVFVVGAYAGVGEPVLVDGQLRDGEGAGDPAVDVDDLVGDALHQAVDGVAEELLGRDKDGEQHEDCHCDLEQHIVLTSSVKTFENCWNCVW